MSVDVKYHAGIYLSMAIMKLGQNVFDKTGKLWDNGAWILISCTEQHKCLMNQQATRICAHKGNIMGFILV